MKKIALLILILASFNGYSQSLEFAIKPYVVKKTVITEDTSFTIRTDTCNKISLSVAVGTDSVGVIYNLYDTKGNVYENGAKNVPLAVLNILVARPISIPAVNMIFQSWFIEAISQL